MAVDDHAIDSLRVWFNIEYEELKKEWKSKKYSTLSECPAYKATAAYKEAMNVLIKACYGNSRKIKSLEQQIAEEVEVEEFWENRK
jgi:hypothetical protein